MDFAFNPNMGLPDEGVPSLDQIIPAGEDAEGNLIFNIPPANHEEMPPPPLASDLDFHANLALELDEKDLSGIAATLLEEIKEDLESREEWEKTITLMLKYLGVHVQEYRNVPFLYACAAFDSTLATALYRSYAMARAELFPAAGPAKGQVLGYPNEDEDDRAERVELFMNYYLTIKDEDYYPDSEQLLLYAIFCGSAFRKVYVDPKTNMPCPRFVKPQDFIVNLDTRSLLSSNRISEATYYTKNEIKKHEETGYFIEGSLPASEDNSSGDESNLRRTIQKLQGINTDAQKKKSIFRYFESHVFLDPSKVEKGMFKAKEGECERPYIVTICEESKKAASIRRAWKKDSRDFEKEHFFVHYYFMKGFGIYGTGLAHLCGSNAITLTSSLRQLIDAATLKNFPGGLKQTGLRVEQNDKAIGPTEFHEVDTGGRDIRDCVMIMPYGEPSQVLASLRSELKADTFGLAGTADAEIPNDTNRTSTITTLAKIEIASRSQSTVLRSFHFALSTELRYLFRLFRDCLPDAPYPFAVPGKHSVVMRSDFSDNISVVPSSDPNVLTSTQRLIKAEAGLNLAMGNPQIHNMREIYRRVYHAMGMENVDGILQPEEQAQALDPISENMRVMNSKPIKASFYQDHHSHNILHEAFAQQMQQINPQAYSMMMDHIQVHKALEKMEQMQMLQQMPHLQQMDPHQFLQDVQLQNVIAKEDADKLVQQQQAQKQEMDSQPKPLDPNAVMVADIEQKREAAHLKDEETKLKVENEAYKAMLKHESEMAKLEAQKEMAEDKNAVNMAIAEMKSPSTHHLPME